MEDLHALDELAIAASDYSHVNVNLKGVDGNAMVLIGVTRKALKRAGASPKELKAFFSQATSGDYDNVLQTIMSWVNVTWGEEHE